MRDRRSGWARRTFCDDGFYVLPAAGGVAAFAGGLAAGVMRRRWPALLGAGLALCAAIGPWLLLGDPSGNFGGLLE